MGFAQPGGGAEVLMNPVFRWYHGVGLCINLS